MGRGEQDLAEVGAVDVLHREVVQAAEDLGAEDLRDVLVAEQADHAGLVQEQGARLAIERALGVEDLQRDVRVPCTTQEHIGHPTLREGLDHIVGPEALAARHRRILNTGHRTSYEGRPRSDSLDDFPVIRGS